MNPRLRILFVFGGICSALFLAIRCAAMVPSTQDSLCREMSRAVYRGSTAAITFWIIIGANPSRSVHGSTPAIHAAAELNRVRVLKLLLAVGADPNLKTKFEMTPLWCAKNMKAEEAAAILIRAGGYAYVSPNAP